MKITVLGALAAALLGSTVAASADPVFNRIASFPVNTNLPADLDQKTETSAEIIAATADGQMLVYSDSPLGAIGFVDIADPAAPKPAGIVRVDGEPTSVTVLGGKVFAGVNTSESYTAPSGNLAVIDIASKTIEASCDLGGQPDSVALSPAGDLLAVAIENERDEDLNDGALPQMPAGYLTLFKINDGVPDCASRQDINLTGLAEIGPEDPEPEFVDFNSRNEIVVTLQENNHLVVVDGNSGKVTAHFPAGTVDVDSVDTKRDGMLSFADKIAGIAREPDAVQWIDDDRFVIANEGDYKGGSRGFSIFSKTGELLFDSGSDFEHRVALAGHFPDKRANKKGVEPEGLEVKRFGEEMLIFVLSERGSAVGVYRDTGAAPEFLQLLPTALAPEGAVAIPGRNLLAVSNEADLVEESGLRSHVTIYSYAEGTASYPMIVSKMDDAGRPVGFGALSGLAADPEVPGKLYAVNDSFYALQPTIFEIDATAHPARITGAIRVTRGGQPAQLLDLEGVAPDGKGGFWLASEGNAAKLVPHALYRVDGKGEIREAVAFPAGLLAHETRFGAEGVAMIGDTLWIAIQRPWKDDPKTAVKLLAYNTGSKEWGAVRYPLDPTETGWVGLSEIVAYGDHVYIIERDNQIGDNAKLKKLFRVPVSALVPAPLGGDLPLVAKEEVRDFIPDLKATGGYVVDKIEGFTVDAAGTGYAVTDNDGVDDSNGETLFFSTGKM
ncbi:esterase-like activity of phytase family protein [Stappia sp.]|uniref:esterase-like activity of phytase family protein n=1 Tax=Stappia sp. TaxID=1870903 RepID=UPI003D14F6CB